MTRIAKTTLPQQLGPRTFGLPEPVAERTSQILFFPMFLGACTCGGIASSAPFSLGLPGLAGILDA